MKYFFKISSIILILCTQLCFAGPFTSYHEQSIGQKLFILLKKQVPLIRDPIITDYVRQLGDKLVAHSSKPYQPFTFFVVRASSINAFAMPAGYVGINGGLILTTQNESELAAVLAHEIAHATQRHIAQMINDQKKSQLASIAAMIAAAALGNGQVASAVSAATMAGSVQHAINFTRAHEKEADRVGMRILANSALDPRSMPVFFGRLAKENRLNAVDVPNFLRTHPVTEDRIADALHRADNYPKKTYASSEEFYLIQARTAVALTRDLPALARHYASLIKHAKKKNDALLYAYTLALTKTHKWQQAQKQINVLIKNHPSQIIFQLTKANIATKSGHNNQALIILKQLYTHNTEYYPLLLQYAASLMRNKQYKKAVYILKSHFDEYSKHEHYLMLLFEAQARAKQKADAHQTRAKIYLMNGNKKAAITQLKIALEFVGHDAFIKHQINRQLKELK